MLQLFGSHYIHVGPNDFCFFLFLLFQNFLLTNQKKIKTKKVDHNKH